jgi:N-acyl homoserine lactone hydrolase
MAPGATDGREWLAAEDRRQRLPCSAAERSPSGLWRRTGNAVRGNASRVRIPPSPPPQTRLLAFEPVDGLQVIALPMGEFTFAPDEPYAGQTGVAVAYAVRHATGVFLFDTGFGFGRADLDDYYKVRNRPVADALTDAGIELAEVTAIANCHLHVDHAGQNARFPRVPIYVQPAEWQVAHGPEEYTILEWIDFPGARYEQVAGDHSPAPKLRIFATPGHSPGHQSLVVESDKGPILLAGQAVYSHGEWAAIPGTREGASRAMDGPAYARSVKRLRAMNPKRVLFGHDRRGWP